MRTFVAGLPKGFRRSVGQDIWLEALHIISCKLRPLIITVREILEASSYIRDTKRVMSGVDCD